MALFSPAKRLGLRPAVVVRVKLHGQTPLDASHFSRTHDLHIVEYCEQLFKDDICQDYASQLHIQVLDMSLDAMILTTIGLVSTSVQFLRTDQKTYSCLSMVSIPLSCARAESTSLLERAFQSSSSISKVSLFCSCSTVPALAT
jgi:hypothetical protein